MTDYIIVGGGSAGCVLANRLSADPSVSVTLIEAGPESNSVFYRMPAGFFRLMQTGKGNWNYETTPQPGLNGRTMYVPRGKVLGGSSAINGLVHVRGNPGDFDRWAQMGNRGWSFADCLPFFKRSENYAGGASEFHGDKGPMKVSEGPALSAMSPVAKAMVEAGVEAGHRYNPDQNGAFQDGFGPASGNFGDGIRQSAYACYVRRVLDRPNLSVLTGAQVSRIVVSGGRATGVEYVRGGRRQTLTAAREVILSGGAIHSPQILQLSGIGDPELLAQHGIPVIAALRAVGENLKDHLAVTVQETMTQPWGALAYVQPLAAAKALLQYMFFKSGPTLSNGLEAMAFVKSRPDLAYPDIQYHLPLLMYSDHGRQIVQREGFMFHSTDCQPDSRGSVRIRSASVADAPVIDPKYLSSDEDMRALRAAIRIAREVIAQPALADLRGEELAPGPDCTSDADLDAYIRSTAISVYHHVGTCRMGPDPTDSVVAPDLKVHGLDGLRVVDASIMPDIITGNTNAATIMIAEKAGDLILGRSSAGE
ncbi:MAG: choline dehydrogenase [Pseudomonadota bacterium]